MSADGPESTDTPTDDLSKPLGKKPKRSRRFVLPMRLVARAVAGVLGVCVAVLAGWILFVDEPYGGEPMVIVSADTRGAPAAAKPGEAAATTKPDAVAPPAALADDKQGGAGPTVTIIDGSTGKRQEVTVAPTAKGNTKAAANPNAKSEAKPSGDPRLLENSRHGTIPKIAPDGARPSEIYAKPVKPQAARSDAPRIAIVLEGLGISANTTNEAFAKLPGEITYAFVPYGTDLDRWVSRARGEGHEVLLQVGMEPFDFPDNDPGPQTLLTSLSAEQNVDRLHWFMSRFQGYVGLTSLMGARFTATDSALLPVLRDVGKRGLIWFDDGTSPRSVAGQISGGHNVAFARADTVLDAVPTGKEIDNALTRLEATARARGVAVASASALPVTIDRLANWARGAEARGLTLVPLSAIAKTTRTAS
jgi:polysaccharide deacetylase 2 family uncharacterized protein YibQ